VVQQAAAETSMHCENAWSLVDHTDRVVGERRLRTLQDLAARTGGARGTEEACRIAGDVLGENRHDVPFALLYLVDNDRRRASLAASVGLDPGGTASPRTVDLTGPETRAAWPVARALSTNSVQQVDDLEKRFGALPGGPWSESPQCAVILPITLAGQQAPAALLVAGTSPRGAADDAWHRFLDLVANLIAATIVRAMADNSLAIRQIVDVIPQMIGVLSTDGTVLYANQAVLDYTGLTAEELMAPDSRSRWLHPADLTRVDEERRKGLLGVVPFKNEQRMRRKDGQHRWCLVQYNPLLDDGGRVIRWYATATDIDDRVRAEEWTRNENLALREQIDRDSMFEDIVGSSGALSKVLHQVNKVACSDSTVLILGETGTGKELIARAIHKRSSRAERPFIPVNCAAITSSLIASELFGHEKGAFTGATQRRLGRFESANGGTIFLDEVGDLPAEIQIALLRVLQEREIERVGSDRPVSVDVRVLAATHRDLNALVAEGRFRQDLLYRLHVVPIEMPSLRERAADIPLLVEYFIDRFGRKTGKKFRTIDKATLGMFQSYAWPGNIRELQNVVERVVILSDGDHFSVDPTWLKRQPPPARPSALPLSGALLGQEKEMIEAALADSRGRVSGPYGAAAKLGIPARTLDSKIRRLGIETYRFKASDGLAGRPRP
jgi:formate hydrogenlyase transcriptional activator